MQKSAMGRERIESPVSADAPPESRSPKPPIGPGRGRGEAGPDYLLYARAGQNKRPRARTAPPFAYMLHARRGIDWPLLARRVPAR